MKKTCLILGGGPSLPDSIKGRRCDNLLTIGVNDSFCFGDWVDACFFCDARWYWWNKEDLSKFKGYKYTVNRHPEDGDLTNERYLKILKSKGGHGIATNRRYLYFNRSSGGSALNLAYHLGATKIILLGYDMKSREGKHNWHDNHKLSHDPDKSYTNMIEPFYTIKKDADKLGLTIYNATPDSALDMFEYHDIEEFQCLK